MRYVCQMLAVQRFSITGALDASFRLYRQHFLPLFLLSLVVNIPNSVLAVLTAIIQHSLPDVLAPMAGDDSLETELAGFLGVATLLFFVVALVSIVAGMFGMAGATHIASQAALGRRPTLGDALSEAVDVFWPLLGATLVMTLAMFVGLMLFFVPGVIVYLGFLFLAPVIVVERTTAVDALGRIWRLSQGRRAKLFGALLLVGLLFTSASGGLVFVGVLGSVFGEGLDQQIVQQLLTQAFTVVATPVWYIAIVLLYYDARVEHDAFDVQMLARLAEEQ
jgi:hypothetical protein